MLASWLPFKTSPFESTLACGNASSPLPVSRLVKFLWRPRMKRVLKPNSLKALILLICLLGCVRSSFATTVIIPSDDDMIVGARAILRGKVLSVGSSFDEQQNRIFTYITLRVQEVLKGQISERKIVIKEEGGQTALRGSKINGT